MDVLAGLSRFKLGVLISVCLWSLYFWGILQPVFTFAPLLAAIPTVTFLSEVIRRIIEYHLGKRTVAIGNDAVLITGCDTGFGYLLSKRLADKGYTVFAGCYVDNGAGAAELREYSSRIQVLNMDVRSDDAVKKARLLVEEKLAGQGLWAVVANAGIANHGPLEWTSMEEIHSIFDVNTYGVLRTVKEFLPLVRKRKGRIVVTTSMLATLPNPLVIPYSMSKAAVRSLVDGLQRELRGFGVYCSSIEPNYYKTSIVENRSMEDYHKKFAALDENLKAEYEGFMDTCRNYLDGVNSFIMSDKIEEPLNAFEHAVCSVRPRPYYLVDSPILSFGRELLKHLNVEVLDAVVCSSQYLGGLKRRICPKK
ncbi:short-chain dehydrogenase/reductase family 9C member 7 [Galendromus occidentalis]|uniref:Short-chain dehydrogenase/reductase family 9C member 7 n=1 Tax=Galendromus occidentalis TaxID=34638 RepID=A0AAJ6VYF2_9ACAR|nr:short-chain dehydrogenase/reductase family 9C member 7 [Galendromus occidentalis]